MNDTLRTIQLTVLAAVLVLPTWGWSESEKRAIEAPGMPIMVCSENLTNCVVDRVLLEDQATCYQRMKRTMVLMNRWLEFAEAYQVSIHDGGIYPILKRHWDNTMKDCVQ